VCVSKLLPLGCYKASLGLFFTRAEGDPIFCPGPRDPSPIWRASCLWPPYTPLAGPCGKFSGPTHSVKSSPGFSRVSGPECLELPPHPHGETLAPPGPGANPKTFLPTSGTYGYPVGQGSDLLVLLCYRDIENSNQVDISR